LIALICCLRLTGFPRADRMVGGDAGRVEREAEIKSDRSSVSVYP
jgi:hypothetical protein